MGLGPVSLMYGSLFLSLKITKIKNNFLPSIGENFRLS